MKKILILISTVLLLAACGVLGSRSNYSEIKVQNTFFKVKFGVSKNSIRYDAFPVFGGEFGGIYWSDITPIYTTDKKNGIFYQILFTLNKASMTQYDNLYNTLKTKYGPIEVRTVNNDVGTRHVFEDGKTECSISYSTKSGTMWLEYHDIRLNNKNELRQYNEL